MSKFRVELHINGSYEDKIIECKSLEIKDNCYCFWKGAYNEPRVLVAAYPMNFTVVREIVND
jgi:hypothetical protein